MYVSDYLQNLLTLLFLRNRECVSDYLRKTLYKTGHKVILGVVISEVFKVTFNSKFKPLFVLFACMCLFACASCVDAADSQIDLGEEDISENVVLDEISYMDSSSDEVANDVPDSIVINHHSHSGNKSHFSHKDKKFANDSSAHHHGHRIHKNGTHGDIRHHHKRPQDMDRLMPDQETSEHAHDGDVQNEKLINTDISAHIFNVTKSVRPVSHVSKLTDQSEISCCGQECSGHSFNIENRNSVICKSIDDNSVYSYEDYYVQFSTVVLADGSANSKSRSSRNHDEGNVLNIISDEDFDGEIMGNLEDSFYGSPEEEIYDGLNIDSLYSELNVNDYNMEYYIFTNPDIIVEKADATENFTLLPKTNILNHCLKFNAKTNNFYHPFSRDCITEDDYVPFNTTFSQKSNFMLLKSNAFSSVQSPVKLADGSAITLLLIFGGIK